MESEAEFLDTGCVGIVGCVIDPEGPLEIDVHMEPDMGLRLRPEQMKYQWMVQTEVGLDFS
jgi:hypothetical protein